MNISGVRLSGFSLDVLDAVAPSPDWRPEETVENAIEHYLADRKLRPPGWPCLPLPDSAPEGANGRDAIELEISDSVLQEVTEEAACQGVSTEALVTHAVMYLWADRQRQDAEDLRAPQRGRAS